MVSIKEVIVVEGRYDKNVLSQIVRGTIVETRGFGIFRDKDRLALLRRLADRRGIIVLTDSDSGGLLIRNYLKGTIPKEKIKHAYIPDVYGKERRKVRAAREGKLGVEGMDPEIILTALKNCGAILGDTAVSSAEIPEITKADLYLSGLSGGAGSRERRRKLLHRLALPGNLSADAMLQAINLLYTPDELRDFILNL